MTEVVRASGADLDQLSHVIADAFLDLPPSHWLIGDQTAWRQIFPSYFRLYLEHALAAGIIHTTADRAAAALWMPVGEQAPGLPADYPERLKALTGPWTRRFLAFDATLDRHHPTGMPHHHLAILAVRPDRQGHRIGTALPNTHHRTLDQGGTVAYLEASSQRSRRLYMRHGYLLRPEGPFCLPEGDRRCGR